MDQEVIKAVNDQGPKERLLEAAIALFAEKGYSKTSVREIVAQAGVTKPVLYYYFESKEGIFLAIMTLAAEMLQQIISEVLQTPGQCLERLIALYQRLSQAIAKYPDLVKLFFTMTFGMSQGAPDCNLEEYPQRINETIKNIYFEGLAKGEVAEVNPEAVSLLFLSLFGLAAHTNGPYFTALEPELVMQTIQLAFRSLEREQG